MGDGYTRGLPYFPEENFKYFIVIKKNEGETIFEVCRYDYYLLEMVINRLNELDTTGNILIRLGISYKEINQSNIKVKTNLTEESYNMIIGLIEKFSSVKNE